MGHRAWLAKVLGSARAEELGVALDSAGIAPGRTKVDRVEQLVDALVTGKVAFPDVATWAHADSVEKMCRTLALFPLGATKKANVQELAKWFEREYRARAAGDGGPGDSGDRGKLLESLAMVLAPMETTDLQDAASLLGGPPAPSREDRLKQVAEALLDHRLPLQAVLTPLTATSLKDVCRIAGLPVSKSWTDNSGAFTSWATSRFGLRRGWHDLPRAGDEHNAHAADAPQSVGALAAKAEGVALQDGGAATKPGSLEAAFESACDWCEALVVATPAMSTSTPSPWASLVKHAPKLGAAYVSLGGLRSEPAALDWLQAHDRLRVIPGIDGSLIGTLYRFQRGGRVRVLVGPVPTAPAEGLVSWEGTEFEPFAMSVDALLTAAREAAHVPTRHELIDYAAAFRAATERLEDLRRHGGSALRRAKVEEPRRDGTGPKLRPGALVPRDPHQLAAAVQRADSALGWLARDRARTSGITPQQVEALELLAARGVLSTSAFAEMLGIDASTASRNIGGLENAGLLVRGRDAEDGRQTVVHLAPAGNLKVEAMTRDTARAFDALLERYSEAERAELAAALEVVAASVSRSRQP